jgi:hypothetical protein
MYQYLMNEAHETQPPAGKTVWGFDQWQLLPVSQDDDPRRL